MKTIFIAFIALGLCTYTLAESKTEIVVKKGIVKTTTDQGDSLIRRGQKAVLEDGKKPAVSLNNKIVEKLLQMDQLIEAERVKGLEKIEYTSAQVYSIDSENLWKIGATMRMPNKSGKPSDTCRFGTTSILQNNRFYDFQGNPLSFTIEKVKPDEGYFHVKFSQPVEPGGEFKFVVIIDFKQNIEDFKLLEKKDGQWVAPLRNGTPNCLNCFQVILPPTGIFVKSDPAPNSIEEVDGRVAVTMQDYTGENGDGTFNVYFLWPEKDGTSLKGIPWTNTGPEAVDIYNMFIDEDIQSPALWGELAIKLVGGGFYDQAYDAFERCYNGHESSVWDYTALTWQGHLHDLWGQREEAIAKYQQALKIKPNSNMRHDQWGMILTKLWLEKRLQEPFTEDILLKNVESRRLLANQFEKIAWKDGGKAALELYQNVVQSDIEEIQGWVPIGLKLVGADYFEEAMDCFQRAETEGSTHSYLFAALIWQGHLLDIKQDREKALEKYYQALEMNDDEVGQMRHDQWGIVLTKDWVRDRLESPFTVEMLK